MRARIAGRAWFEARRPYRWRIRGRRGARRAPHHEDVGVRGQGGRPNCQMTVSKGSSHIRSLGRTPRSQDSRSDIGRSRQSPGHLDVDVTFHGIARLVW
jgi:hypothetical protein